jgi:hypothetical protein
VHEATHAAQRFYYSAWSHDELAVLVANHARGDSVRLSARILARRAPSVRQKEIARGLRRGPSKGER